MAKVVVIYSQCCPECTETRRLWEQLKREGGFEYQEVEVAAEYGIEWILRYDIRWVPTTVIDERVAFVGKPDPETARALLARGSHSDQEP